MIPEAAEPTTIAECRRCGATPGRGVSYVYNGIYLWKCDECGREMHEGVLEEVNREQVESEMGYRKALENRERYTREWGEKMIGDYFRGKESMKPYDPEEDVGYVFQKILPG